MYYKKFVRETYDEAIRLHPTINSELKIALKSNERVPAFIDYLADEIEIAQDAMIAKGAEKIKDETLKGLVYDLTNLFIQGLEKRANERMESDAMRLLRKAKEDYKKDLDESATGNLTGDFAELAKDGLKIGDSSNEQK